MALNLHLFVIFCLIQSLTIAAVNQICQNTCNNTQVYFPFGIGQGCYMNKSFEVICDSSVSPPKLFLPSIDMEIYNISLGSQVRVKNPVISSDCFQTSYNSPRISLSETPFVYSNVDNRFVATGCNNYAMLLDGTGDIIGGCLSFCPGSSYNNGSGCYGINCCEASIPPYINSFMVNMTTPLSNDSSSCQSAFMVDQEWFAEWFSSDGDLNQLDNVPAVLDWGKEQGYCDISKAPNVSCTRDSTYCWKRMNTSQLCICNQCQDFRRCTDPSNYYDCKLYCLSTPGGYRCPCPPGHSYSGSRCFPDHVLWGNSKSKTKSIIAIGVASGFGLLILLLSLGYSIS